MTRKGERTPPLTIPQAAAQLGTSRIHVYRLIHMGLLGCLDMPGTGDRCVLRVEQADVDRFLAKYRKPATA